MESIVSDLVAAFGLFWLALMLFGLVAGFLRGRSHEPSWWDLSEDERDHQLAIEQARGEYVSALRKPTPPPLRTAGIDGQPVRDELLKLAGKIDDRRRRELRRVPNQDTAAS